MPAHEPTEQEWRILARQASKERDPDKLLELTQQLIEKFDDNYRLSGQSQSTPHCGAEIVKAVAGPVILRRSRES